MLEKMCGSIPIVSADDHPTSDAAVRVDLRPCPVQVSSAGEVPLWRLVWDGQDDPACAGVAPLQAGSRSATVELVASGKRLDFSCIKTVPHSLARTRQRLIDAAAVMIARAVRLFLARQSPSAVPVPPSLPGAPRTSLSIGAKLRNAFGRVSREAWEERWRVGILSQTPEELATGYDGSKVTWLPPRKNGYHADPFGVAASAGQYEIIFAEAYDFAERLGYIVSIDREGNEQTVLREPFHLSFPQIVEQAGETWLLPEAKAAGCLRLYRPDPFPQRFVRGPVLIENIAAADPTLFCDEQGYWLFAGDGAAQDETTLVLYHADQLMGPWRPHPMNPIKIDLGSARPAGPLFRTAGKLWRPAQDCRRSYGGAIVLNEVLALTPEIYVERQGPRLLPDARGPCPDGLHSLTPFGDGFLIDGKREYRSAKRLAAGLRSLARG